MKTVMNRMKLFGFIRIFRPELSFAAGVTVLVGEMFALNEIPIPTGSTSLLHYNDRGIQTQ